MKFGRSRIGRSFKNVHAAFVVRKHSVPTFVIGAVGKHIHTAVIFPTHPTFDEQALVEIEIYLARARARSIGIRDRPITEPEIHLAAFCACSAICGLTRGWQRRCKTSA